MSQPIKSFFSGVIIQSLVTAVIIGAISIILDEKFHDIEENSKVSREAQIATVKLETQIPRLTKAVDTLSDKLEGLFEHQVEHEKAIPLYNIWKTTVDFKISKIPEMAEDIDSVLMRCRNNEENIRDCKRHFGIKDK